ncbi:MAG: hypothetical protein EA412_09580 [Chitinophagaceae bacterium]|nr:MAG: hypothetical protein EA412_09580 [Chitinophagaceae bacterium]
MWQKLSIFIIKYRLALLIFLAVSTVFMAYQATKIEFKYGFASLIPPSDPKYIDYQNFLEEFGEDGSAVVLASQSSRLFEKDFVNSWFEMGEKIKALEGVENILSYTHAFDIKRDNEKRAFVIEEIMQKPLQTDSELNDFKEKIDKLLFYDGFLINREENSILMIVFFDEETMVSDLSLENVEEIKKFTAQFEEQTSEKIHSTGFTFIRAYKMASISEELRTLLFFASLFVLIVLTFLFRSFYPVIFPMLVISIGVIWSIGCLVLLNYELTILTGLVPNLILIIGIPNCVYILNKYHLELTKHGHKIRALTRVIEKIGYITFFANLTTAIGFGVFAFTQSGILKEFGIVAGLMISATFFISLISIPVIFSYLPKPKEKQTYHLDDKWTKSTLSFLDTITSTNRPIIYIVSIVIVGGSLYGMAQLKPKGYILDDVPEHTDVYKDLKFVDDKFNGVMPFEIIIDTRKKGAASQLSTLRKVESLQDSLAHIDVLSKPISVVNGLKFATQAYFNGNPNHYRLPRDNVIQPEITFILNYLRNSEAEESLLQNFVDTTNQKLRISYRMRDVGSHVLPGIMDSMQGIIDLYLPPEDYDVTLTGTIVVAFAGFNYLITGLLNSLLIAFILIALIMTYLFRSAKMLFISLIPNIIPLMVTAGIMGYFNVPVKPSTVIIFSVAFGISVDFTIHFLAKYKQEFKRHSWNVPKTVSHTIHETGISMIYTSLILFFGFITFTISDFEGTWFLGVLTSLTLMGALFSNLILLPALLLSLEGKKRKEIE